MVGIYCIRNRLDNKRYIGKSRNVKHRIASHKINLRKHKDNPQKYKKSVNRHLANAVAKYGIENFEFEILEEFENPSEEELSDAEIKWMLHFKTTDRSFGYNLKMDSSTKTIVHKETIKLISENNMGKNNPNFGNSWTEDQKKRMSEIKKEQMKLPCYDFMKTDEWKEKVSRHTTEMWKDEDKKAAMAKKVSESRSELMFQQYDKVTGELIAEYNSIAEIIDKYPDFHRIAIYSVCNGWKKSYRGFVWKSSPKNR